MTVAEGDGEDNEFWFLIEKKEEEYKSPCITGVLPVGDVTVSPRDFTDSSRGQNPDVLVVAGLWEREGERALGWE